MAVDPDTVAFDDRGLVPAVVQDATTGTVLMLAYMNREALTATLDTGWVHFWSRSRQELWRKGATSGHTLELVGVTADCDADTLLVRVLPHGPTCHTGTMTCFGEPPTGEGEIRRLWATILDRAATLPDGSYTAALIRGGPDATGRKVVEEATEVLIAAKDHAGGGRRERVVEEAADLVYHLLVTLAERGVDLAEVEEELAHRAR